MRVCIAPWGVILDRGGLLFLLPFGSFLEYSDKALTIQLTDVNFLLPFGSFFVTVAILAAVTGSKDFLLPFGSFATMTIIAIDSAIDGVALSTPFWEFLKSCYRYCASRL